MPARRLRDTPSFRGECHPARRPIEQFCDQVLFERIDQLGHGGDTDTELASRPRHTFLGRGGGEILQCPKLVHECLLSDELEPKVSAACTCGSIPCRQADA